MKINDMKGAKDYRIFILDGDIFSLNIYQQHLINLGYTDISTYHKPADCLNNLASMPDIIFLDHSIDFSNGVEVLKKIKNFNPDIYVVFIAGGEDLELVVDSLKHGAFDFIVRGENDVKTLNNVIARIQRIKQLLKKSGVESYSEFTSNFPST